MSPFRDVNNNYLSVRLDSGLCLVYLRSAAQISYIINFPVQGRTLNCCSQDEEVVQDGFVDSVVRISFI